MNRGRVFLVGPNAGALTPMVEKNFELEDHLQKLLADYPDLLPGDQINPEAPRRWLLVAREMAVPDPNGFAKRWSLDHLFLDQDAIPTFVECKRASDTRIRREVVAQMLDYAANGLKFWDVATLRQAAEATATSRNRTLDAEVQTLLGSDALMDSAGFWAKVETNLRESNVRLLFVADNIPAELRRLVEFMNEKIDNVEVLAVEIKQFLSDSNHQVVVPRLIGMSEAARTKKPATYSHTSEADFLQNCPPAAAQVFKQVLAQAQARGYSIEWGKVGFAVRAVVEAAPTSVVYGWPPASPPMRLEIYTANFKVSPERMAAIRTAIGDLGIFTRSGEHTYRAPITPENTLQIADAIPALFLLIEQIISGTL